MLDHMSERRPWRRSLYRFLDRTGDIVGVLCAFVLLVGPWSTGLLLAGVTWYGVGMAAFVAGLLEDRRDERNREVKGLRHQAALLSGIAGMTEDDPAAAMAWMHHMVTINTELADAIDGVASPSRHCAGMPSDQRGSHE